MVINKNERMAVRGLDNQSSRDFQKFLSSEDAKYFQDKFRRAEYDGETQSEVCRSARTSEFCVTKRGKKFYFSFGDMTLTRHTALSVLHEYLGSNRFPVDELPDKLDELLKTHSELKEMSPLGLIVEHRLFTIARPVTSKSHAWVQSMNNKIVVNKGLPNIVT